MRNSMNWGRGFWTLFAYRLLTNGRAIAYFYLAVMYELDKVYVELTLIRIVLSWGAAMIISALVPNFIGMLSCRLSNRSCTARRCLCVCAICDGWCSLHDSFLPLGHTR
jgi:hypothetical protein